MAQFVKQQGPVAASLQTHAAPTARTITHQIGNQAMLRRMPAAVGKDAPPEQPKATGDPITDAGLKNPLQDTRYIDNLFEGMGYSMLNGAFTFHWEEAGKRKELTIANYRLIEDNSIVFDMDVNVQPDINAAIDEALDYWLDGQRVCTFYRASGGVIMPLYFTPSTTPKIHAFLPELRQGLSDRVDDVTESALMMGNAINPFPGTTLNAKGELEISSNPMDLLALLHVVKMHLATREGTPPKPRSKVPKPKTITRSFRSVGIPYHVTGLEADFNAAQGICVYVLKDSEGGVLYVGKGEFFGDRLREHLGNTRNRQWEYWGPQVSQIELHGTELSEIQSLAQEEDLVEKLLNAGEPIHNRDTRSYSSKFGEVPRSQNLPRNVQVRRFTVSFDPP